MSPDPRTDSSLTMAAAPAAACRPPVEERAEVTYQHYITTRRKGRSDLDEEFPETLQESELGAKTSGAVFLYVFVKFLGVRATRVPD